MICGQRELELESMLLKLLSTHLAMRALSKLPARIKGDACLPCTRVRTMSQPQLVEKITEIAENLKE